MCGIVGIVRFDDAPVERSTLDRARDRLAHRGPDDAGTWISADGSVGLAHRRLSILDTSEAGHQPMASVDGRYIVSFNGEIYNYLDLRRELADRGYVFRTRCDTEVIPAAFDAWGPACVERFIGMFAFGIWDTRERRLFLARDRLGIKPLYYAARPGVFLFASRLGALLAFPDCPRNLDEQALSFYLEVGWVPGPWSILGGVRKLLPGHTLLVQDGAAQDRTYWSLRNVRVDPSLEEAPEEEVADRLDALLRESVKLRLLSDVPLGAFLSGGIDSSTVVALMSRLSDTTPQTFSIGFEDSFYNEAPYAANVARHLGTRHHERIVRSNDVLQVLDRYATSYDEPLADYSGLPTMMLSEFTREHVTVALSGDGGDELFAGYEEYRYLSAMRPAYSAPRPVRGFAGRLLSAVGNHRLAVLGGAMGQDDPVGTFAFLRSIIRDHGLSTLMESRMQRLEELYRDALAGFENDDPVAQACRLDATYYMVDSILQKVDVASMAFGLEARVPVLDHRVVEFAFSLPLRFRMQRGTQKVALRNVLSRYVPAELFERPKTGFGIPLREWFRGELRGMIEEELAPARIEALGLVKPDGVRALLDLHLSGRRDVHAVLWALLALVRWHRHILTTGSGT